MKNFFRRAREKRKFYVFIEILNCIVTSLKTLWLETAEKAPPGSLETVISDTNAKNVEKIWRDGNQPKMNMKN